MPCHNGSLNSDQYAVHSSQAIQRLNFSRTQELDCHGVDYFIMVVIASCLKCRAKVIRNITSIDPPTDPSTTCDDTSWYKGNSAQLDTSMQNVCSQTMVAHLQKPGMCGACQIVVQQAEIHSKNVDDGPHCAGQHVAQAKEHLHLQTDNALSLCCTDMKPGLTPPTQNIRALCTGIGAGQS